MARCGNARPSRGSRRASARNCSGPMAIIVERPIAESIEYRPPTQSQKPNILAVSMPNFATSSVFVETATKCLATAFFIAERLHAPIAGGAGIGERFQRREGLGGDDEERFGGVEIARRLDEIGAVHIGDEAAGQVAVAVVPERLIRHHRAEVRAADADIDDIRASACRCVPSMRRCARARRSPPSYPAPRGPPARRSGRPP